MKKLMEEPMTIIGSFWELMKHLNALTMPFLNSKEVMKQDFAVQVILHMVNMMSIAQMEIQKIWNHILILLLTLKLSNVVVKVKTVKKSLQLLHHHAKEKDVSLLHHNQLMTNACIFILTIPVWF